MKKKTKLSHPSREEISKLRICLGMTGLAMVNDVGAETILMVMSEMKRLGGEYSLDDAAKIEDAIAQKYKEMKKKK
jgi:hypothetical protein